MGIGYVVFMALGEIWGQWLHWVTAGRRFSLREARLFLRSANWINVLGMIALTALFFSWFWPWTFQRWCQHLPRMWLGAADQLFTGPLSLAPIFLLHAWTDARGLPGEIAAGWRFRLRSKAQGLLETLRVALPYWGIGLGLIFSLPFDFVFQNILTGAIQTPFTTYLFLMANRSHGHSAPSRMRSWAKWSLPLIAMHNLIVFPIWCNGFTLALGLAAYTLWLALGFAPGRREIQQNPDAGVQG